MLRLDELRDVNLKMKLDVVITNNMSMIQKTIPKYDIHILTNDCYIKF